MEPCSEATARPHIPLRAVSRPSRKRADSTGISPVSLPRRYEGRLPLRKLRKRRRRPRGAFRCALLRLCDNRKRDGTGCLHAPRDYDDESQSRVGLAAVAATGEHHGRHIGPRRARVLAPRIQHWNFGISRYRTLMAMSESSQPPPPPPRPQPPPPPPPSPRLAPAPPAWPDLDMDNTSGQRERAMLPPAIRRR